MDFISGIGASEVNMVGFGFGFILKLIFVILFGMYIFYSFFLALRIRILSDTVQTASNSLLKRLAFLHLYAVILIGLLAMALIILA